MYEYKIVWINDIKMKWIEDVHSSWFINSKGVVPCIYIFFFFSIIKRKAAEWVSAENSNLKLP